MNQEIIRHRAATDKIKRVPALEYVRDERGALIPIRFLTPDELLRLLNVVSYVRIKK